MVGIVHCVLTDISPGKLKTFKSKFVSKINYQNAHLSKCFY